MPTVLVTLGLLDIGGAELQVCLLIQELLRRGWRVELLVLDPNGPLKAVLERYGAVIHDGGYGGYKGSARLLMKIFQLIRAQYRLWRLCRQLRPVVLHALLPPTNFMGALAGFMAGASRIITCRRGLGTYQDRYPLWRYFDILANWLSHRVTVNSRAVWQDVLRRENISPEKLVLIPNALDFSRFAGADQQRGSLRQTLKLDASIGIVMVANLLPCKGHGDVLHALASIMPEAPHVTMYFVGQDRGIQASLEHLADSLGIRQQVVFLGSRQDIPALLAAMDIFVLASHEEGFSNALLEGMASGLPVVATDVGGNREALEEGKVGMLVPPHAPEALANALKHLLADPAERQRLGALARTSVAGRYSIKAMAEAHIEVYLG